MATSFYQRQADAKKNSSKLIAMFILAVVLIVVSVSGVAWFLQKQFFIGETKLQPSGVGNDQRELTIAILAGLGTLCLIAIGSAFKIFQLRRGGGTLVAESLGGRRLANSTTNPDHRKLMNVVEEMAIASGMPVPPVFILDEDGINAFAAGYSPSDAVLGVTRGCVEQLPRNELQGVIAHEFSHILNGDMRLSIKLMGVLHGILLLGLTGQFILRNYFWFGSGTRSRRRGKSEGGGGVIILILAVSVSAIIIGSIGVLFGNLIKAAVSRQREFLADASAVQFTRDSSGIANALKRIGGAKEGSQIKASNASEASHLFFSQGVWAGVNGLWATHPPLNARIRAIDPHWDGKLPAATRTGPATSKHSAISGFAATQQDVSGSTNANLGSIQQGLDSVGEPTFRHQQYAAELIHSIPEQVTDNAREAYGARAVIFGLLMDSDPEIRADQMRVLKEHSTPDIYQLVSKLQPLIDSVDIRARLPLIDLTLPALQSLSSKTQYVNFSKCFNELIKADKKIELFEWILIQVLSRHLKPHFDKTRPKTAQIGKIRKLRSEYEVLLSAIALAGNTPEQAGVAFQAGSKVLGDESIRLLPRSQSNLSNLQKSLNKLALLYAAQRRRIIDACAAAVEADGHITLQEAELLRGVADLLDCPIPPVLPSA